jgi:hypothetical protein
LLNGRKYRIKLQIDEHLVLILTDYEIKNKNGDYNLKELDLLRVVGASLLRRIATLSV